MGNRVKSRAVIRSSAGLVLAAGVSLFLLFSCSRGLSTVTSIKATPNGTSLDLTWGVVSGVSQYAVYLSQSSNVSPTSYTKVYTSEIPSLTITGLTLGGTYYLVIVPIALGGLASGPVSGVVKVVINGYVVTSITATTTGSTLNVSWPAVSGVAKYSIYLSQSSTVSPTSYTNTYTTTAPTTTLTVNGLAVGTTYYLVVVPADSSGTAIGPASSVVSVDMNGYAYTSNGGTTGTVAGFAMGSGGAPTPLSGNPFSTGSQPLGVAMSPNNKYLYVANDSSRTISSFSIGSDGSLTPFAAVTVSSTAAPVGVAVSPSGNYVYVADDGGNLIWSYAVNSNGSLLPTGTSYIPPDITPKPYNIAITPGGSYLYFTENGANKVAWFNVNTTTGALTGGTSVSTGSAPWGIATSPDGKYLYVSNAGSNTISVFSIGSGGVPSPVPPAMPAGTGGLSGPNGIVITPNGSYVYAANTASGANSISGYSIGTGGVLSPIAGSPFATGTAPVGVAVSHDGRYLYSINGGAGTIKAFSIGSTGALTAVSNGTALAGSGGWGIAISH